MNPSELTCQDEAAACPECARLRAQVDGLEDGAADHADAFVAVVRQRDAFGRQLVRLRAVLDRIACWSDGEPVGGRCAEPVAARIARDALRAA